MIHETIAKACLITIARTSYNRQVVSANYSINLKQHYASYHLVKSCTVFSQKLFHGFCRNLVEIDPLCPRNGSQLHCCTGHMGKLTGQLFKGIQEYQEKTTHIIAQVLNIIHSSLNLNRHTVVSNLNMFNSLAFLFINTMGFIHKTLPNQFQVIYKKI